MSDDRDNLNPTPEARLAMVIWSDEYAFKQRVGSMDFWHNLDAGRQNTCRRCLRDIAKTAIAHGRSLEDMAEANDAS